MGFHGIVAKESSQPQIAQLCHALRCQKHIGWLDIAMHDTAVVAMLKTGGDLVEILPALGVNTAGYTKSFVLEYSFLET